MIPTLIVEDELHVAERLSQLIQEKYFDGLKLVGVASNVEKANTLLSTFGPKLVFLDVEIGQENAFEWLKTLKQIDFHIIFTTAHHKYAVDAFKWSAIDYLLKPIDEDDLADAVNKFLKFFQAEEQAEKVQNLLHNMYSFNQANKRVCISTGQGLLFLQQNDIIRFESSGNYTYVFLKNKQKLLVSKTLKEFDDILGESSFYRVHQSHLINLDFVKYFERGKGGYLELTDGAKIEVSVRKKEGFLEKMMKGW